MVLRLASIPLFFLALLAVGLGGFDNFVAGGMTPFAYKAFGIAIALAVVGGILRCFAPQGS